MSTDTRWTRFTDRLPSLQDADSARQVLALQADGSTKPVLWDWVPPSTVNAGQVWEANGFVSWHRAEFPYFA